MIHKLKIEANYFKNLLSGIKKVEIRLNDRDYQRGDILQFDVYLDGRWVERTFEITHIHSGLGMEGNYVALSVQMAEA